MGRWTSINQTISITISFYFYGLIVYITSFIFASFMIVFVYQDIKGLVQGCRQMKTCDTYMLGLWLSGHSRRSKQPRLTSFWFILFYLSLLRCHQGRRRGIGAFYTHPSEIKNFKTCVFLMRSHSVEIDQLFSSRSKGWYPKQKT